MTADWLPAAPALRAWPERELAQWEPLTARVRSLADGSVSTPAYERAKTEVQRLIDSGDLDTLRARLPDRHIARALVSLWQHDDSRTTVSLRRSMLSALVNAHDGDLPRPIVSGLVSLVILRFDLLDDLESDLFGDLVTLIANHIAATPRRSARPRTSDAYSLVEASGVASTIGRDAPQRIAEQVLVADESLHGWLTRHGRRALDQGRLGQLLRQQVYLSRIRAADHTTDDGLEFLVDLPRHDLANRGGSEGMLFGHDLLMALTDRTTGKPSEFWVHTILAIGGDPRLEHTKEWHEWWRPLPSRHAETARRWMSVEDLRLFLTAVENFGFDSGHDDQVRMFAARKVFLEGLYDTGKIQQTRLVMGSTVRSSVRRQTKHSKYPIALLRSEMDRAVIIADCGDFHLIEGSHNFSLWIYAGAAPLSLMDLATREFAGHELRRSIPQRHAASSPFGDDGHVSITHNGLWQRRALEFIVQKLDVELDVHRLLSSQDYAKLKREWGLPIRGAQRLMPGRR